ncbi:hypothetical protein GmHk_06G016316 [Glycine max]|nr:hypothetical protein GmHk_06G016316 [Glycine max]
MADIKTFMNYTSSYKKTWLAKQRVLEMIHGNGEESYAKLPLQSCVPGTVFVAQTEFYSVILLIATTQDGAIDIFPIVYAIVGGETTSAWIFPKEFKKA